MKAEKIRVALEKIKEAQVKKVRPPLSFVHTLSRLDSFQKTPSDLCNNRCLVIFYRTLRFFFVNFIHGEGSEAQRKIGQCSV